MLFPSVTTIRLRLILLVVLCALAFSGVAVFHSVLDRNRKVAGLQKETAQMTRSTAEDVRRMVESTRKMLRSLASNEAVNSMDGTAASALFAEKLKQSPSYLNIGLAQPDGTILASGLPPEQRPARLSDRTYATRLQKTRDFGVSEYVSGEVANKPSINLGVPLPARPGALPTGVVFVSLDLDVLRDCLGKTKLPGSGVSLVTDRKGIYLARHPDVDQWVGTKALSWEMMETKGDARVGFIESTGADQIPRSYYYTPVPDSDGSLFVAVGVSNAAILAECRDGLLHQLYWIGFWTALGLVGAWYLGSFYAALLKRAQQQKETTRRIEKENLIASPENNITSPEPQPQPEPIPQIVAEDLTVRHENNVAEPEPQPQLKPIPQIVAKDLTVRPENNVAEPEPQPQPEPTRRIGAEDLIADLENNIAEPEPQPLPEPTQRSEREYFNPDPINLHFHMSAYPNTNPNPNSTDGLSELQQLVQSFESMATVLRSHNERLERAVKEQASAVNAIDSAWEQEIARHRQAEISLKAKRIEQEQVVKQLQDALDQVQSIKGLLPTPGRSEMNGAANGQHYQAEPLNSARFDVQHSNGSGTDSTKKQSPNLKMDLPATPIKLNGFDSGALFFGERKADQKNSL